MKRFLLPLVFTLGLGACADADLTGPSATCTAPGTLNPMHSKAAALSAILQHYTTAGLPGCAVAVYSPTEGYWAGAAGFAKLEDQTPMQICHLQYGQSVAKTYLAVAVLKLYEAGRLPLDAPITDYLTASVSKQLPSADQITVRMLLNHTSGLPDYTIDPTYTAYLLQHPRSPLTTADYLGYLTAKKLDFKPGSKFTYSNTNYMVLALVADFITGDHARYLQETIFTPLGLRNTFYHNSPTYLQQPDVVNCYLERFGNGRVENVSQMQQISVGSMVGDDGLVASPLDFVTFLRALFEDRLLQPATRQQMMTWVNDHKTNKPTYGLGLYRVEHQGKVAYGHGGGGIGAGCALYYLPEQQIYFFLGVNLGTLTEGKLVSKAGELRKALLDELVK
ncbi:serine hydrolase domain-containing protein [Hymenobacter volaticus]|uniref:Beta-lactamase family protein n=1 Tax=Hymenobacter volaticus TaxID=2932254 RepID=A0ABY4GF65_9BACT|nr:serine hydrolase domain-containing protein [Hymenobacter volaticus]UOQ68994.1 beta-lactamase family protein [Hymenobacter volaticus]